MVNTDEQINEIMANMGYANHNFIHYTEFLAATIHIDSSTISSNRRDAIFKIFDVDGENGISRKGFVKAFNKIGRIISDKEVQEIFDKFDKDKDQVISREEWRKVVDDLFDEPEDLEPYKFEAYELMSSILDAVHE
mmetsp:Transcript_38537/g.27897  ORF Transcript_38537/g.27897 Transcript_38537/m.27897 type:complete len:136 (+) Transcript_38537:1129-1536(+)